MTYFLKTFHTLSVCITPGGGGLNLDQAGTVLYCIVLYCIVLYCIVLYCIVLYCTVLYCIVLYCIVLYCTVLETKIMFTLYLFNQMSLPFPFSSIMFVQKSFTFSITVISLSYDICNAFQD